MSHCFGNRTLYKPIIVCSKDKRLTSIPFTCTNEIVKGEHVSDYKSIIMIIHLLVVNVRVSDELKTPFMSILTEYSYFIHGSKPSTNMLVGFSDTGFSSVSLFSPPSFSEY